MASFNPDEVNDDQLDWIILRDVGTALYWRLEILTLDLSWFEAQGYSLISFDTSQWKSEVDMHASLKAKLSFPDYYGHNLNALNECLRDDLVVPDTAGLVLVLHHCDTFAKALPPFGTPATLLADSLLDIFNRAVRYHMLFGRRLIVLVQSDDPRISFDELGGTSALWNHREWLNSSRGL
jgi:RNAse (barnase) inhibitor barstar